MNGMGNCGMESMPHFEWECILQVGMCIGIGVGMCVVRYAQKMQCMDEED